MLYEIDTQYLTLDESRFDAIKEGNPKFKKQYLLIRRLAISLINTAAANDVKKTRFLIKTQWLDCRLSGPKPSSYSQRHIATGALATYQN